MKIITISTSPYMLVRNGRINSDVLQRFVGLGHEVTSVAWAHDESQFMADPEGVTTYDINDKPLCRLYPFLPTADQVVFVYEMMKKLQPQVVITIGDCHEVAFLHAVKAMYPSFFKWVAILTVESPAINENLRDELQYVDQAVVLSDMGEAAVREVYAGPITKLKYGPSALFRPLEDDLRAKTLWKTASFIALRNARNFQTSNIAAFLKAIGNMKGQVKGYLHTNSYDPGESDLTLLLDRYGAREHVTTTEEFCSIYEGISDESLNDIYNRTHVVVDTSTSSATALSLLEAMATGAIPVGTDYGAVGEVIRLMPPEFRYLLPHEVFVGSRETEFAVVSVRKLEECLLQLRNMYLDEPLSYAKASDEAMRISRNFLKEEFLHGLQIVVDSVSKRGDMVLLEQHT